MMAMGGGLPSGQATPYPGHEAWTQPPPAPRRARWLLAAGAAAALGAIVAGGLIAASRSSSSPPPAAPAPAPVASVPSVTPMTGAAPAARVRVRVDAPAGAHVEAIGAAVALCDTPCVLEIDPADGGSTMRRDFVVRQDGFADAPFSVDLAKPPAAIEIALEQIIMNDPTVEIATPGETSSGRSGRRDRPRETGREPVKITPPPPPIEPPSGGSAAPTAGSGAGSGSGSAKKPKDTKVDPTVTIDPFAGGG